MRQTRRSGAGGRRRVRGAAPGDGRRPGADRGREHREDPGPARRRARRTVDPASRPASESPCSTVSTRAEVLEFADLAMYEAKEAGRNRVAMYGATAVPRTRVAAAGRGGADPQGPRGGPPDPLLSADPRSRKRTRSASTSSCCGCAPTTAASPLVPSAFLYVAERFGLIQEIDGWVARQAIELIAEHGTRGPEARAPRQPLGQVDRRSHGRRAHRERDRRTPGSIPRAWSSS